MARSYFRASKNLFILPGELLFIISNRAFKTYWFYAIGLVLKIQRGELFDVVTARFGFGVTKTRNIIVSHSRARRQILTLKRGQYAHFAGIAEVRWIQPEDETKGRYKSWQFFGWALQGWYVPTAFDVKKRDKDIEEGLDENHIDPINKKFEDFNKKVIENIFEKDEFFGWEDKKEDE